MIGITGAEIMNSDLMHVQVRRCTTCGEIMGPGHLGPCSKCKGFVVTLGPINWNEGDELKAIEDLDVEDTKEDFQDIVCMLWDEIEASDDLIDEKDAEIEELKAEIVITKNAVKMTDEKVKELEAKLADETITGKVKKAFGAE